MRKYMFLQSVLQFINSERVMLAIWLCLVIFAIEVATFISNQFSKFISKRSPDRHVNVYRTKVILHMHYRVEMSAIVSMDIIDSEIKKNINTYTYSWCMTVNVKLLPTSIKSYRYTRGYFEAFAEELCIPFRHS